MPDDQKLNNVTQKRLEEFVARLTKLGGSCGNERLRQELNWNKDFYWKVQGRLIEQGRILPGRGRGGSVRLPEPQVEAASPAPASSWSETQAKEREKDLYGPLKESIEKKWINRFGFDDCYVAETHSRGSKDTGGTFTRPDITVAGVKRYIYLPKRLEIVTFEVKPASAVSIMGALEAIAHREVSHRSYVIYPISRQKFESETEAERITELSQKYGIGILLAEKPDDVETWEIVLDAIRHEPDPARLDRFLADLPSDTMRGKLARWKE